MDYEIVTDSGCNLAESYIESVGLHVIPLTLIIDGVQYQGYRKGEETDYQQFYTMMREGKTITTSLPNLAETRQLFQGILSQGRDLIYLGFSSALSSAFEAITLMLNELREDFPGRAIYSVDTLGASGGQGLLVYHTVKKAQEGLPIDELAQWAEENRYHLAHWFTVDDLMFLFRGGRVSKTSAWAGTMLNIKPVMHVDNEGRLIPVEKARGRKKSLNALVDHMRATALQPVSEQTVFINHGDCLEDAQYLAGMIRDEFGVTDITINYVDPVIGAHSGPGTMALFFLAEKR